MQVHRFSGNMERGRRVFVQLPTRFWGRRLQLFVRDVVRLVCLECRGGHTRADVDVSVVFCLRSMRWNLKVDGHNGPRRKRVGPAIMGGSHPVFDGY